jgi:dihydroorotase
VTIVDPNWQWTVDPKRFRSKSSNTPLAGLTLRGLTTHTIVGGDVRYAV